MFPGNAFVSLVQANHMIDVLGVGQSGRRQVEVSDMAGTWLRGAAVISKRHFARPAAYMSSLGQWSSITLPVLAVPCRAHYAAHSRKRSHTPLDWFPGPSLCVLQVAGKLDPGIVSRFIIFVRKQQAQQKAAGSTIGDSGGANMDLLGCDTFLPILTAWSPQHAYRARFCLTAIMLLA